MQVLGHAGITLGAAVGLSGLLSSVRFSDTARDEAVRSSSSPSANARTPNDFSIQKLSWLASLGSRIDIRLLLIGSLLPDIIDKPVGLVLFRESLGGGRIFGHTLLFFILVTVAGLFLYRRHGRTWLLAFSFGTLTHLIFDQMWSRPITLLWPILGLSFERTELAGWLARRWHALFTDPAVYVPELAGLSIFIWFVWILVRSRRTHAFVRYGRIQ